MIMILYDSQIIILTNDCVTFGRYGTALSSESLAFFNRGDNDSSGVDVIKCDGRSFESERENYLCD